MSIEKIINSSILEKNIVKNKSVCVLAYNGIGDTIILGPLLRALDKILPAKVLFPDNPMLATFKTLGVRTLARPLDPCYRKINGDDTHTTRLDALLKKINIGAIFHLRRDYVENKEQIVSAHSRLRENGIAVWDMCVDQSEHNKIHSYELARRCLADANIVAPVTPGNWLARAAMNIDTKQERSGVLIYTGSGQVHKRWPPKLWAKLISELYAAKHSISILPGFDADERRDSIELKNELDNLDIRPQILPPSSIANVSKYIMRHRHVISTDTYVVHLSCSLGVPVLGIYLATDPVIYGPLGRGASIVSPFFYECPRRTRIGNCDAWELGCAERTCLHELDVNMVIDCTLNWLNKESCE